MNAVSQVPPAQPTTENGGNTPGGLLRQEREQRGLTVQQVSEQLLLDTWLVEALEENRFLALGAPVYAKGHLRKYAVLLGLSPDLILARYQLIAEPHPAPLPPPEGLVTPPALDRRLDWRRLDWRRLDWRIYAAIGGLALTSTAVGWLLAHSSRSDSSDAQVATRSQTTPAQPPADIDAVPPEASTAAPPQGTATVPAVVPSAQPTTNTPPKVAAEQTPAAAASKPKSSPPVTAVPKVAAAAPATVTPKQQPPAVVPATASRPAPAITTAAVPPKVQAPAGAQPQPAAAGTQVAKTVPGSGGSARQPAAPASPPEIPPEIPPVSLRLEFAVASWAEVYDGDGRRLLYAVGDPNRPRTISGKPPLKVTLGMAGSVQARVNGRPIAIPRRIGQDSASFTVTAKGSIR